MASTIKDIIAFLKPMLDQYTGGKTLPKFAVDFAKKHTVKQITKWTPNLSKTVLYAKSNRGELGSAFFKLLSGKDELSKQFRKSFSEACRLLNHKVGMLITEKNQIAEVLDKQDKIEDNVKLLNQVQADEQVDILVEDAMVEIDNLNLENTNQEDSDNE
ncbi:MAG: hypothetical protein LBU60_04190 [Clostridiales bacterium]|jgi:hypothetical protein|nr:hypothetical protein [Clostridiales bacterium]